jgi:HlyD family secretion protein
MSAEIYDWGGRPFPGMVRRVEPQGFTKISALGVEEQRVLVLIQFAGAAPSRERIGPGYRLRGRVVLRREPSAARLPIGALVRSGGGWSTFRVENGRARLRGLEIGAIDGGDVEVLSGVSPGDSVVVFPTDRIRDGVRVRPRASTAPNSAPVRAPA